MEAKMEESMKRCDASNSPLSPIRFIERAAIVYGDSTSLVYNSTGFTWSHTYQRCRRLASALSARNISPRDVVSVVAPNIPAIYEMHFAVPMAGAILNTVNTRLDARTMAAQFNHCHPKIVFADYQFVPLVTEALHGTNHKPSLVLIQELVNGRELVPTSTATATTYEGLLQEGDPEFETRWPVDEWQSIVVNYTSGTTSAPKGVVHSHRGIYAMVMDALLTWGMKPQPVYLWTLPMFHANGWSFPWGMAALGGTNVCLRKFDAKIVYKALIDHRVTHLCGAPVVLSMIANADPSERKSLPGRVEILTSESPPPAALLLKVEELGFSVTHGYGLTETGGVVVTCVWKSEWDRLPAEERAKLKARQGVRGLALAELDVKDPGSMNSVARDGVKMGEVMLRGPSIMKGYLKDEKSTDKAMEGGWFLHRGRGSNPSGRLPGNKRPFQRRYNIRGGRTSAAWRWSLCLYSHPMVVEAGVVARPDSFWGESPCAFVSTNPSVQGITEAEMISFSRDRLPHYMVPKTVVFMESLPKTSTGKIQKHVLREMAKKLPQPKHRSEKMGSLSKL